MFHRHQILRGLPDPVTAKDVAQIGGVTPAAVYKMIQEARSIGGWFQHKPGVGYYIPRDKFVDIVRDPVYELTERGELFDCYWGRFNVLSFDRDEIETIIKNRNEFARTWKLKNKSQIYTETMGVLDHLEVYTMEGTKDRLVLFSPYRGNNSHEKLGLRGLVEVPMLYCNSAKSFVFSYQENKCLIK